MNENKEFFSPPSGIVDVSRCSENSVSAVFALPSIKGVGGLGRG